MFNRPFNVQYTIQIVKKSDSAFNAYSIFSVQGAIQCSVLIQYSMNHSTFNAYSTFN